MERKRISSGSKFEALAGYSRAVIDGEWVFVSGTTGYDYATGALSEDPVEQTEQTFRNIIETLEQAGASLGDVVRVRVFILNQEDLIKISEVVGKYFRDIRPANTTVCTALALPEMKVEIEVTAKRQI